MKTRQHDKVVAGDKKLFLGGRFKRLRRELGLTQTRMAQDLGLSPSYLNHLERNQRAVSAQVLLRLAETYDLDLRAFSGDADVVAEADLGEALLDPLFAGLAVPRHEVSGLVESSPALAEAVVRLYRGFADRGRRLEALEGADTAGIETRSSPVERVRDHLQAHRNHFPELESAAERICAELPAGAALEGAAVARLSERHGVRSAVLPAEVMLHHLRRYDPHRRRLMLNETLSAQSRTFAVARQIAALEGAELIEAAVERAQTADLATRRLLTVALTDHLAGAIVMPYAAFHGAAEALRYDLLRLSARFGASFEQVAHRLTTLSRPEARGVPFFMLRFDRAGNVSKRYAAGASPFARLGGGCPRWNVHAAFQTPGRLLTQLVETADGGRFLTLARTVPRAGASSGGEDGEVAVALGCEARHAGRLVYGAAFEGSAPVEIGASCRLCERPACRERAAPPATRTITPDDLSKFDFPYPFSTHG